jgi:hypothetical protein
MKVHAFEEAGLGKAPFRFVAIERRPGGCHYCGTAIYEHCIIVSADEKVFAVGTTCVYKTGDRGLVDTVKRAAREAKREAQYERDLKRIQDARAALSEVADVLAAHPHPYGFAGATLLDWAKWMLANAGNSGRLKAARAIERAAKEEQR